MWCPQLLIRSHAFPSLDSRSFDCITLSAQGFVVALLFFFFISFTVSKSLIFLIMSLIPHRLSHSGQKIIFFEEKKRTYLEILTVKTTFLVVLSGIQGW